MTANRKQKSELPALIGLCGFKRSGKDTVAGELVTHYGYTRFAFADAVRDELRLVHGIVPPPDNQKDVPGPDGKTYRDKVIEVGEGRRRSIPLYWVMEVDRRLHALAAPRVVVSDCRTEAEMEWVRALGGVLVWIDRDGVVSNGHATEQDHRQACDIVLHNDLNTPEALVASILDQLMAAAGRSRKALPQVTYETIAGVGEE